MPASKQDLPLDQESKRSRETRQVPRKAGNTKRPRWPEIPTGPDLSELAEFDALDDVFPWPVWERGAL